LPGNAGPETIFLRTTFFAALRRDCALEIASSAIWSPVSGCWLSHSEKLSLMTPPTKAAD
jgi:hypothetical protein